MSSLSDGMRRVRLSYFLVTNRYAIIHTKTAINTFGIVINFLLSSTSILFFSTIASRSANTDLYILDNSAFSFCLFSISLFFSLNMVLNDFMVCLSN